MSQKALKRKIRRGTDDSDSDFKLPAHYSKKESLNTSEEGVKTRQNHNGSGSNNESDSDDNIALKNFIGMEDNGKCDSPTTRSRSTTPKINKSKEIEQEQSEELEVEKVESCTNGKEHTAENGKEEEECKTIEMEPLLLDSEEPEPELMFPEEESGSEFTCSDKGSPILSRSVTRRSHTRNIPTPKTPKSVYEQNGSTDSEQQSANIIPLPVISLERLPETETPNSVEAEVEVEESSQTSTMDSSTSEIATVVEEQPQEGAGTDVETPTEHQQDLTIDSCVSANECNDSLLVNITGDDATRNIEFSCRDPSILDESTDSLYKNRSYRSLSARRSIRPNSEDVYRRKAFHNMKEEGGRSSMDRTGTGIKRKQRSTTPDGPKRYKLEPDPERSPGLLSYISSPIINIKNRFSRTQLPQSSTPILKGYKQANPLLASTEGNAQTTTDTVDETHVIPEKKWCVIM